MVFTAYGVALSGPFRVSVGLGGRVVHSGAAFWVKVAHGLLFSCCVWGKVARGLLFWCFVDGERFMLVRAWGIILVLRL